MTAFWNRGRVAGLLYVLVSVSGFFAMGYVPAKLIVSSGPAATAHNLIAHETLFRAGIAAQLLGEAAFVLVALALYWLLEGVDRRLAATMVILITASVPIAVLNEANSLAALALVRGQDSLAVFDASQRSAAAMFFLHLHGRGLALAEIFWGLWLLPLATLVYRSRFLPRFLGIWLALAGVAWVLLSLTSIVLPQFQDAVYRDTQPLVLGEIVFMLWLLIKGATPPEVPA